jgi:asparagine synthetase A
MYTDQGDWERVISPAERNLVFLQDIVGKIWKVFLEAECYAQELFPDLHAKKCPNLPEKLKRLHAEDPWKLYRNLRRKRRPSSRNVRRFSLSASAALKDGYRARNVRRRLRAADDRDGSARREDASWPERVLVWNHATQRRHELSSPRHSRECRDTGDLAWSVGPDQLPEISVVPGNLERRKSSSALGEGWPNRARSAHAPGC